MGTRTKKKDAKGKGESNGRHERFAGPRPLWSGTISFGLVAVPVQLFPANRSAGPSLRMLAPDGAPLRRVYECEEDGRELGPDDLVRAWEADDGELVPVPDEELASVAPRKSRDIDLRLFTDRESLEPLRFERAYVLTPGGDTTKPYRLLAEVMELEGRVGIATFVMRDKEYLVAILARDGILWAETLRFADELRDPEEHGLPAPGEPVDVPRFARALRSLERASVEREELVDERLERLRALVAEKQRRGRDVVEAPRSPRKGRGRAAPPEERNGDPPDLFEVIRARLRGEAPPQAEDAGSNGLESSTKDELYERARELDLPGRSGMSKAELVAALRERAG